VTVAVAANRSVFKARFDVSEPAQPLSAQLAVSDFELFGVPVQFAQDRAQLDARWKDLQREAHPDKFASQGTAAQRVAMQWSVRINEAYQRLKDPMRRATYLCELGGAPIQAENNTAMPAAFLMQQMEWREAMDEANDVAALEDLFDDVQQAHKVALQQCAQLIDAAHDLPAAAQQVRGLMFIEKFLRDVEARMDHLDAH
jgi:molecular chaperone HscB